MYAICANWFFLQKTLAAVNLKKNDIVVNKCYGYDVEYKENCELIIFSLNYFP